ncbi:MAG: hypothetical protein HYY46_09170 [Deltaproteobacteria bacterium]|nr:hypothetical protein [Deltaproteobacteria bacterium]
MESRSKKQIFVTILLLLPLLAPSLGAKTQDPWQFLNGFTLISDSPARIEEHYVAALFVNREKQQLAVVIFNATCDSGNCEVNHRAAYSVYNKEGRNIRTYVDPGEQELMRLFAQKVAV